MNILYIGAESANWVTSLCDEMCQQGHTVTCVVQQEDEYDKESEHTIHENLNIIRVDWNTFFNPTLMKSKLLVTMTQNKFDVIFGSHAPVVPALVEIGKMKQIPWGVMLLDISKDLMEEKSGIQKSIKQPENNLQIELDYCLDDILKNIEPKLHHYIKD